jgi:hypothetical protein
MKALLLDEHIPWANPGLNLALINCGIMNNVVCPLGGENAWDIFFKANPEHGLKSYFEKRRDHILYLTQVRPDAANPFENLRLAWFSFRKALLLAPPPDEEDWAESDVVISRCIEELSALAELQNAYPDVRAQNPWNFFLRALRDKYYVKKPEQYGVSVYPFPVAAGAPFKKHFFLNMNQKNASLIYRDMDFLRPDIRRNLGLADSDVSAAVFAIAAEGENPAWFSAGQKSAGGYAVPHNAFKCYDVNTNNAAFRAEDADLNDLGAALYLEERAWWAGEGSEPEQISPMQETGFAAWNGRRDGGERLNMFKSRFPQDAAPFAAFLAEARTALPISATGGLNVYAQCSMSWFLRSRHLCGLYAKELEAALFGPPLRGLFYHAALKAFFTRIRREEPGGVFRADDMRMFRRQEPQRAVNCVRNHYRQEREN